MLKGLIGKKIGMTQIFDETGMAIPVTLSKLGHAMLPRCALPEQDGYSAVQLGFEEVKPKRLTGGQLGHLKRNNLPPLRFLREFREKDPEVNEGDKLTVDIFAVGVACGYRWDQQGKGFRGSSEALSLPRWSQDPWSVGSGARPWLPRLRYHPGTRV